MLTPVITHSDRISVLTDLGNALTQMKRLSVDAKSYHDYLISIEFDARDSLDEVYEILNAGPNMSLKVDTVQAALSWASTFPELLRAGREPAGAEFQIIPNGQVVTGWPANWVSAYNSWSAGDKGLISFICSMDSNWTSVLSHDGNPFDGWYAGDKFTISGASAASYNDEGCEVYAVGIFNDMVTGLWFKPSNPTFYRALTAVGHELSLTLTPTELITNSANDITTRPAKATIESAYITP